MAYAKRNKYRCSCHNKDVTFGRMAAQELGKFGGDAIRVLASFGPYSDPPKRRKNTKRRKTNK